MSFHADLSCLLAFLPVVFTIKTTLQLIIVSEEESSWNRTGQFRPPKLVTLRRARLRSFGQTCPVMRKWVVSGMSSGWRPHLSTASDRSLVCLPLPARAYRTCLSTWPD